MLVVWEQLAAIEPGQWLLAILAPVGIGLATFLVTWGRVKTHDEEQTKSIDLLFQKVNEHGEQLARVETNVEWLVQEVRKNGGKTLKPQGGK